VVFVTTGSGEEAESISRALVDERLAACVNVLPGVTSVYRWQGRVERAAETLLIIKTEQRRLDAVIDRVRALHSYTVPEIVALRIDGGSESYLRWLDGEVAR
jgi:periplasmic divalent cation tolerance protein